MEPVSAINNKANNELGIQYFVFGGKAVPSDFWK
tara:strand:- start:214 stop:315 length:102 start_codon:yes stop_codon:yes gene_type:complete